MAAGVALPVVQPIAPSSAELNVFNRYKAEVAQKLGRTSFDWRIEMADTTHAAYPTVKRYLVWEILGPEYNNKSFLTEFSLVQLPGCCGVCVSFHAALANPFKKRGLGTIFNKVRIDLARTLGYGIILSTDVLSNQVQRKIFEKNEWKDICTFTNPRTTHVVAISVKELR